jgi:D-glycero-D-manno-heptose 1,7-bisphosphate phosphatase
MQKHHVILLDLNGTLNDKSGYFHPSELEVAPWAIKAIQLFNRHGLPIAIVTNQSGIADGKFSHEEFRESLERILSLLGKEHSLKPFTTAHIAKKTIVQTKNLKTV